MKRRYRSRNKFLVVILLTLTVSLSVMGLVESHWYEALYTTSKITTGTWAKPPPQIDGTATGSIRSTSVTTTTLTTTQTNDIIYFFVAIHSETALVTGVTNGGPNSLTWSRRVRITNPSGGGTGVIVEAWYAKSSAIFSGTITVAINQNTEVEVVAFGISGANFASPFDPNLATPVTAIGTSNSPTVSITTSYANDLIIGGLGVWAATTPSAGSGYTLLPTPAYTASLRLAGEYRAVTTVQTTTPINFSITSNSNWAVIGDAIQGAP